MSAIRGVGPMLAGGWPYVCNRGPMMDTGYNSCFLSASPTAWIRPRGNHALGISSIELVNLEPVSCVGRLSPNSISGGL